MRRCRRSNGIEWRPERRVVGLKCRMPRRDGTHSAPRSPANDAASTAVHEAVDRLPLNDAYFESGGVGIGISHTWFQPVASDLAAVRASS